MNDKIMDGISIDRDAAKDEICPECENPLRYEPDFTDGVYRAFLKCDSCGWECEF